MNEEISIIREEALQESLDLTDFLIQEIAKLEPTLYGALFSNLALLQTTMSLVKNDTMRKLFIIEIDIVVNCFKKEIENGSDSTTR
jgi:hypothetical protein